MEACTRALGMDKSQLLLFALAYPTLTISRGSKRHCMHYQYRRPTLKSKRPRMCAARRMTTDSGGLSGGKDPTENPEEPQRVDKEESEGIEGQLFVGDVVGEWLQARDKGDTPQERGRRIRTDRAGRKLVTVLFCDRDNRSSSVIAETVFSMMVEERNLQGRIRCSSAGTHVSKGTSGINLLETGGIAEPGENGLLVQSCVVEELRHQWKADVGRRMAVGLDCEDLTGYNYVCCLDEATRSHVLYSLADTEGRIPDDMGGRINVLSAYAKNRKWRSAQWSGRGQHSKQAVKVLCKGIADACEGLLDFIVQDLDR